ncbi:MAG: LysR substrate-binding domain-containing protein [Pseudomonadota bacterium]
MDLKQLNYFVHVSDLGSFVKAAELLGIAQPTLSRQIRALEIDVKASLFHRNGRGVMLTAAGARFLEQARGVLHASEAALQVLHTGDSRLSGRVVCGMTPSVGSFMIPHYVRRFRQELPHASLSIVNHLSAALLDQIKASRLDFAIFHNPPPTPNLTMTPLSDEELYLIGPRRIGRRKASVDFRELDGLPLIMPSRLHAIRGPVELEAARLDITLNVTLEVDIMQTIFQLAAEGAGHTIATRFPLTGQPAKAGLFAQRITAPELLTHLVLVTPSQRVLTPLQRAATDLASATYLELVHQLR